jgi:hypothetical protein
MHQPDLLTGAATLLFLAAVGLNALYFTRGDRSDLPLQIRLFLVALAIRFAVSLLVYQGGLVDLFKDEDASGWLRGALLHAEWERRHLSLFDLPAALSQSLVEVHSGYRVMLAVLFFILGTPERLGAAALNCFFGAFTVVFTYRTARLLFSLGVAQRAAWWTCWFPSLVVWSAQTLKEPVVICLETAALYGCVSLRQRGFSARHLALCAGAILLLVPFRFYAAYVVGAAVLLALLMPAMPRRRNRAASLALLAVLLPVIGVMGPLARHEAASDWLALDRIEQFRRGVSDRTQGSGVRTEDIRTSHGFVTGIAVGAAHLLLAPFPWEIQAGSARMLLTLPELLFWWWLFFAGVLPGVRFATRHRLRDVAGMLLLLVAFGLLYSMVFGNVGLVYRQRAQLLPWLLIFAAVGLEQRALRRSAVPQVVDVRPLAEARA